LTVAPKRSACAMERFSPQHPSVSYHLS